MARPDTEDNCHGDQKCRESYEAVADEYVRRIADELRHKPLDRALLDKFCQRVRTMGPVCEVGCGPGHVARYLHGQGLCVTGVDLSPALIERARKLSPDVEFSVADMTALPHADGAWAGLVAFYSLIHVARDDMPRALAELWRVLQPGGLLLAAFHIGTDTVHLDEWWGARVDVDFHFFQPAEFCGWLRSAGFEVEQMTERDPYPEVEHQSRRCYVFAQKAANPRISCHRDDA
jgi:SAM-dependent methyltransferase